MSKLDELLEEWRKDADIDRTEPGKALLDIPKLHSKYLNILSRHRLLSKEAEFKYNKMKKLKWEYYTGKLDDDDLKKYEWDPFPYVLKSDLSTYMESDEAGTSSQVYVNGVIKPANDTSVGFYEKPSLQNASFYRPETE